MANDFKLESHIGDFIAGMNVRADKTASEVAFDIRASMIAKMKGPKSGRLNRRKGTLRSAPGEAPAIDTGAFAGSIFVVAGQGEAVVGSNDDKAIRLEFGDVHMAARPVFGPAFEEAAAGFQEKLAEIVKQ